MEVSLIFRLCFSLLCRRGNNHFDVHFRPIGPVVFPSKDAKDAVLEEKMDGRVFNSRQSRNLFLYKKYDKRTSP